MIGQPVIEIGSAKERRRDGADIVSQAEREHRANTTEQR
jgi:hypothetical protein